MGFEKVPGGKDKVLVTWIIDPENDKMYNMLVNAKLYDNPRVITRNIYKGYPEYMDYSKDIEYPTMHDGLVEYLREREQEARYEPVDDLPF